MIIGTDTETYEERGEYLVPVRNARRYVIGCMITEDNKRKIFYNPNKQADYILDLTDNAIKDKEQLIICAHEALYDFVAIFRDKLVSERIKYLSPRNPFIGIIDEHTYFIDTRGFFQTRLYYLGLEMGIPKLTMPMKIKHPKQLIHYVTRDTEICLYSLLELRQLIAQLGYKPRKMLTAGQLAITSYLTYLKRKGQHTKIQRYNEDLKRYETVKTKYPEIREAYRGGRNEAFQTGEWKKVTQIDINSLYPYIASEMPFPNLRTEKRIRQPSQKVMKFIINQGRIGIAQCIMQANNPETPILPIRYQGLQVYPKSSKMIGTWTLEEIRKAIEQGYELKQTNWVIYYATLKENPMKDYITEMYQIRLKSNDRMVKAIKLLLNNLIGKFGQTRTRKTVIIRTRAESKKYIEQGYKIEAAIGHQYMLSREGNNYEPGYTNPLICSLVNALARIELWENLTKIPKKDLLYTDTDSIIFKGNHLKKFKIGKQLGEWKIETKTHPDRKETLKNVPCKIIGEKRYYVGESAKLSGVPTNQITKKAIQTQEPIHTKRMIGINKGMRMGDMTKVGTFQDVILNIKNTAKLNMILPEEINETGRKKWY